ncbi:MAG: amino acid adenylation domain-containing protein, partial [Bacilli bacterium]|nr:amino acid adenylation domain-containing protein [Bacilli bacterium]
LLNNGDDISPEKNPSYVDYILDEANYKSSKRFIDDQQYWLQKFDSVPEVTSLKTRTTNERNTKSKRKTIVTPIKFINKLRQFCKENNTSPYPLFLAALAMYINRIISKNDIVIGTPILNRSTRKDKDTAGMFINTLPLLISIDSNTNFKTFSSDVSIECMSLLRHQKYPYDLLLKNIRSKYNNSENLYDIVLSYQNSKMEKKATDDHYSTRWHFNQHQVNSLTIHINDRDDDGQLIIDYDFHEDMYSVKEIEFLHTHMLSLLWHALDNPFKSINKIDMLPESEKFKVLYDFNNTKSAYKRDKTIHQLFEEQVERTPESIALVFEDTTMTYKELNRKANQLAYALSERGLQPQEIVGIMVNRSIEMIIGILATLKLGCAYLPIDPNFPVHRIKYILDDSNSKILLSQKDLITKKEYESDYIDLFDKSIYQGNSANLCILCKESDLAYIIYTSGSSGNPKGVELTHRGLSNFVFSMKKLLEFKSEKTIVSITTISFDIFIFETLLPLTQGLKIIIANNDESKTPHLLSNLIMKHNVNIIQTTPSVMSFILDNLSDHSCFESITDIVIGGEKFPNLLLDKLKTSTNAKIYNGYGPSETTIYSTFKDLTNTSKINIGVPIPNTFVYILDDNKNLVPIGVYGELYIGGDGVGQGYLNNSRLTSEKFIMNPFRPEEIIYKTGDIARWFPAGEIEYLGRKDFQVKIRGLRIELEEIEKELLKINGINNATVSVRQSNDTIDNYLCAYYTSEKELSVQEIRNHLLDKLPNYMVPHFFNRIDNIPLTANGKVDKIRLPNISVTETVNKHYTPPRNRIDSCLVMLWKGILNVDNIGIDSNFFELGGDSLKAIQLQVRLIQYGWNLTTQDIYKYNTIRKLSDKITKLDCSSLHQSKSSIAMAQPNFPTKHVFTDLRIEKASFNNVLLTGATGFLGIHILDYILS